MDDAPSHRIQGDILIVDDNPTNLRLLDHMLRAQGHRVRLVPDGKRAVLTARSTPPDLILLDVKMPNVSGFQVCEQLKEHARTRDIPVIFISALDDAQDKIKAFEVGGLDYITKPFHVEEVLARVHTHLALYNLQRRTETQNRQLQALADMGREISGTLDLATVLDLTTGHFCDFFRVDYCAMLLHDEDQGTWRYARARGVPAEVFTILSQMTLEGPEIACGESGRVLQPLNLEDASAAVATGHPITKWVQLLNVQSALVVPLEFAGNTLGALILGTQPGVRRSFAGEDMNVALTMAGQAAMAIQNARLYQKSRRLAIWEERQRLARELHDSVAQSLYSLALLTEGGRRLASAGSLSNAAEYFADLREIALQTLKEMRLLVYQLRPSALERAGLVGALQQRLDVVESRAGMEASLVVEGEIELASPVEEALYNIAQEALNNALKHATATTLTVRMCVDGEWAELEVSDNGRGFDPCQVGETEGMGLTTMRERAEQIGGMLTMLSQPGTGTSVKVRVRTSGDTEVQS